MLDVSWGELLVIGTVALVVIGPKDLPKALRALGQATAKLRRMAGEFQNQFNEAMREAELEEIKKSVSSVGEAAQNLNPLQTIHDEIKGAIDGRAETKPADIPTSSEPTPPLQLAEVPPIPDASGIVADAAQGAPLKTAVEPPEAHQSPHIPTPGKEEAAKGDEVSAGRKTA